MRFTLAARRGGRRWGFCLAIGRTIRLQFAVATKLKNPDVHMYEVEADPRQVNRTKRIVDRVWEGD